MKHKLCAICPVCRASVSLDGRRITRHTTYARFRAKPIVCDGTNSIATDADVRFWLTRESKRADDLRAEAYRERERADRLRVKADECDAEAATLRAFVAAQLAKLEGAS